MLEIVGIYVPRYVATLSVIANAFVVSNAFKMEVYGIMRHVSSYVLAH